MSIKGRKKLTITNPIFYPSGKLHLGSAHTMILSKFLKDIGELCGYEAEILGGLDENSQKVIEYVAKLNKTTKTQITVMEFLNNYAKELKKLMKLLKINETYFIRTTDKKHHLHVQKYWTELLKKGFIEKGVYKGWYSVKSESFVLEDDVKDGFNKDGEPVTFISQPCYYFLANKFEKKIKKFLKTDVIVPNNMKNLLHAYMKPGLKKLCISRYKKKGDLLGIPVPNDPNHTIYVWFDALLNYLHVDNWNNKVFHLIAKDIAQFHGIFWPAILIANDKKLFDKLIIHNWLITKNNQKMSKSDGNTMDPLRLIEKYGANAILFYTVKNNLLSNDGYFSEENLVKDHNTYLVNKFSNLIYRVWSVLYKKGIIPQKGQKKYEEEEKIKKYLEEGKINSIVEVLFAWVEKLNSQFDHGRLWENIEKSSIIMEEIIELSKYWLSFFQIPVNWKGKPVKIFEAIEAQIVTAV